MADGCGVRARVAVPMDPLTLALILLLLLVLLGGGGYAYRSGGGYVSPVSLAGSRAEPHRVVAQYNHRAPQARPRGELSLVWLVERGLGGRRGSAGRHGDLPLSARGAELMRSWA